MKCHGSKSPESRKRGGGSGLTGVGGGTLGHWVGRTNKGGGSGLSVEHWTTHRIPLTSGPLVSYWCHTNYPNWLSANYNRAAKIIPGHVFLRLFISWVWFGFGVGLGSTVFPARLGLIVLPSGFRPHCFSSLCKGTIKHMQLHIYNCSESGLEWQYDGGMAAMAPRRRCWYQLWMADAVTQLD